MESLEEQLYNACESNLLSRAKDLLNNPAINVNWANRSTRRTALHIACRWGHVDIVRLLLQHPAIDVNQQTVFMETPFHLAAWSGCTNVVQLLVRDPRIDINKPSHKSQTPMWNAAYWNFIEIVESLIASGRELDLETRANNSFGKGLTTPLEIARVEQKQPVIDLLERFIANPAQTRFETQRKLGMGDAFIPELFVLIIFTSDGYLNVEEHPQEAGAVEQEKPNEDLVSEAGIEDSLVSKTEFRAAQAIRKEKSRRFFNIAKRLPMELQMILCHRVYGSFKSMISSRDSEPAFREVARRLTKGH